MSSGIIHTRDELARPVVIVPLQEGTKGAAIVDQDDFEFLSSIGCSMAWNRLRNGNIVTPCSRSKTNWLLVARILTDANPGQVVAFRDGDNSNLRRSNLVVVFGRSYRHDRAILTTKPVRFGELIDA